MPIAFAKYQNIAITGNNVITQYRLQLYHLYQTHCPLTSICRSNSLSLREDNEEFTSVLLG